MLQPKKSRTTYVQMKNWITLLIRGIIYWYSLIFPNRIITLLMTRFKRFWLNYYYFMQHTHFKTSLLRKFFIKVAEIWLLLPSRLKMTWQTKYNSTDCGGICDVTFEDLHGWWCWYVENKFRQRNCKPYVCIFFYLFHYIFIHN